MSTALDNAAGKVVGAQVAKRYEPTPQERAMMDAYLARHDGANQCPDVKVAERNEGISEITIDHADPHIGMVLLMRALGTSAAAFYTTLIPQLAAAAPKCASETGALNFMLAVVKAVGPKDEIESLLAAQMAAVHVATMHMAARLSNAETVPQRESAERGLNKLVRTFTGQLDTLKRYRSGGEQKVTVEHVHVYPGGQAIVGHVEHSGEGEPKQKNGSTPCS
jgi:hypothetical protein